MTTDFALDITLTNQKKEIPPFDQLVFGTNFTDHMFIWDYTTGKGWHDARIVPYQPILLDPAATVFHYGQSVFEGLKAYRTNDEEILLFRPDQNMKRFNKSNQRLVMPQFDEDFALHALKKLIEIDREWVPNLPGTSLYVRPFMIATEAHLGVDPANNYKFMIILSPVGSYYKEGINPVKIAVENKYVRAVAGGTGDAKTAGNYAASLLASEIASENGYSQVLWLDGRERQYIEEVGSMNIFFKINGEVITPELNGSILDGITRKSIIELLKYWNIPVTERRISIHEIQQAYNDGVLEEVFGTGTAAVISPVGELFYNHEKLTINNCETGVLSKKLYDTITSIQNGTEEDPFGWTVKL